MAQTGITTSALKSPMTLSNSLPLTWEGTSARLIVISLRSNWQRREHRTMIPGGLGAQWSLNTTSNAHFTQDCLTVRPNTSHLQHRHKHVRCIPPQPLQRRTQSPIVDFVWHYHFRGNKEATSRRLQRCSNAFMADTDAKTHPRTIIKVRPPKNPPFARRIIRGRCVIFPVFDVRLPI